jgi:uncharacterized membrane protein
VRSDRGTVTVEYAILVPVVLLMLFTSMQVALYSFARSVAATAAEEAVNAQRGYQADSGVGYAKAQSVITSQGDVLSSWKIVPGGTATEVTFTVQGESISLFPGIKGFSVSQTASGPIEEFNG